MGQHGKMKTAPTGRLSNLSYNDDPINQEIFRIFDRQFDLFEPGDEPLFYEEPRQRRIIRNNKDSRWMTENINQKNKGKYSIFTFMTFFLKILS